MLAGFAAAGCGASPAPPRSSPAPLAAEATPQTIPSEMVLVPGGAFVRGRDRAPRRDEAPAHEVFVRAFAVDRTLVTRAAFARFVERTGYVTTAERVGLGTGAREGMGDWEWERIPHASWRRPFRDAETTPDATPTAAADLAAFLRDDAPVVMVSWHDAAAFCADAGKRLPTEAEWERAMRAGAGASRYPWGDSPTDPSGKLLLNFWQGASHEKNDREDGFVYVSPVTAFPPNALGIHDPVGNVWQWTADWYAPDAYARAAPRAVDPRGPARGKERVLRGGSWWCGACTCEGNGLHYRGKSHPDAAFNNNGFRCAADVGAARARAPTE